MTKNKFLEKYPEFKLKTEEKFTGDFFLEVVPTEDIEEILDKYFIRKQKIINTIDKLFHGTPELLSALIYNNILKNLENLENAKERT